MTFKERLVPFGPHQGKTLNVQTPTHVHSRLAFAGGAEVMLTTSFDVWKHAHTPIELYGEKGSILVPDPNKFAGRVRYSAYNGDWRTVDYAKPYRGNCRGIGLIDLAAAIDEGREPRCGGALALHVLEVMDKSLESARLGKPLNLETSCERPAALLKRLY